ncbi:DUF5677 domain-containing protein [Vibrio sp. 99-70-13A1]|uniref:DUF5677 domain-containing protein n=1 Tax=Vibrio sp. 99-70-13A1 TaxID=2607601 RepID=UPI00149364E5|nr:DUF5677 domain-containing protein [Vibrio sp. 99-70-13A1]NOH99360.1 hypothetical protein [Vibrio sp. 99-70-13A1]
MTINILSDSIDFSKNRIVKIDLLRNNKYHAYSAAIYCSLIELAQSFELLSSKGLETGALAIYRSFLEHYVDLVNLRGDEKYINVMELDDAKSRLKHLQQAEAGNLYMSSLLPLVDEKIPLIEKEIKYLQDLLGKKHVTILEKFQLATMESEYKGLYSYLCGDVHSSISSLFHRHFRETEDKTTYSLVLNGSETSDSDIFYYGNMAQYLTHAGLMLCQITDNALQSEFEIFMQEIWESAV